MDNDENDKSLSQESNSKSQRLPIYSNESKLLKILGQIQDTDQKNNRYIQNFKCSSCIDNDCDFIYTFEKFNNITTKLTRDMKQDIFISTLIEYFKNHNQKCKTKDSMINFLKHYKLRYDKSVIFTPLDEETAKFSFQLKKQLPIFDIIKKNNDKIMCLNIFDIDKKSKIKIFCCNCKFENSVNIPPVNISSYKTYPPAVHDCETGSQMISKKRNISEVVTANKEKTNDESKAVMEKTKKQRINPNKKQINIMDILKKKKIKENDTEVKNVKPDGEVVSIAEQESRLQKLDPSDFVNKRISDSITLAAKNKSAIINNRSVSAGGALTLKKSSNPSALSRSVSENKLGIDMSLLFDSEEEEDMIKTGIDEVPNDLDIELSSSENQPTKQGDLIGKLDLDLLDISDIEPDQAAENEGSTYAPKVKEEANLVKPMKKTQTFIPLSSASLKHVQDVSRVTNDSDSQPNNSRYTHREVIQSRVISDIPVDFGKIQDFKNSPQVVEIQKDQTPEPNVPQRQASVLENIQSPILKKTRQQVRPTSKQGSKRKKYIGFSPQSNNIMDNYEEFDENRNISLRNASIHSPKRLKKLVLSEDIKNVDKETLRKLSQKDDILSEKEEVSKVDSAVSQSPSVIINRPDDDIEVNNDGSVSFIIQELRPSTPQQADVEVEQEISIQSEHIPKANSPIKVPIIMESPVHSEIKKFTALKSSPSKPQTDVLNNQAEENVDESDSELLLSINNNKSVLSDPKANVLLDLKNQSIEILDSFKDEAIDGEVAYTGMTFHNLHQLDLKSLSLYLARRAVTIANISSTIDFSLHNESLREFSDSLPKQFLKNEKSLYLGLLSNHYTKEKQFLQDSHTSLMKKIDDCEDMETLINLYNKLK